MRRLPLCRLAFVWVGLLAFVWATAQPGERIPFNPALADSFFYPGMLAVKLKPGAGIQWQQDGHGQWQTGNQSWNVALRKMGITQVATLYQPVVNLALASENETAVAHMQQAGLDRWFCFSFPAGQSVTQVWQSLQGLPGLEEVSPMGRTTRQGIPADTRFAEQWHWQNTGQSGGTPGADVKAVPAWDINTGSPDVVVSVHDGGVPATHPDLQQNMWFGIGYNFVTDGPTQNPDNHGTHVAGLVAAVRNNNLGVSGMAGGNGNASSGARIMSLQIIGGTPVMAAPEAQAMVFAANNGASISQNSWSYLAPDFFPSYMADAIDYFIAFGGGSVLKGGLVVFAAGNYNTESKYYPAPYSRVLAVGATNHNDVRASYSSYGHWVDLVAPGGESTAPILSTVLNNGYGTLFGTSMSCPMVSGAAALLVSHLPGRLLADDVRSLLLYGTDDIYPLNTAALQGKLGSGRLNAYKALLRADSIKQLATLLPVVNAQAQVSCNAVQLSWNALAPGTQVLVAYADAAASIGSPFGLQPSVGDSLPFGGVVLYKGNANSVSLPLPIDGSQVRYRIWVNDGSAYNYSTGTDVLATVPNTVYNISASGAVSSIQLNWQRQCPNSGGLLAFSTDAVFGLPAGDPAALTSISGGGTVLQYGEQTSFLHSGLPGDKLYYYAFYPYRQAGGQWQYGAPQKIAAGTSCQPVNLPIAESFAGNDFPSSNWRITDGGPAGSLQPDGKTWRRVDLAGSTPADTKAALINAYTQNGGNSKELLRTPAFAVGANLDSLIVSFDYAYRAYSNDADLSDSLALVWTDDCGTSLRTIWKAGGAGLSTVPGFSTAEFVPRNATDWKAMRFDLKKILPANASTVAVGFFGTNKFGQNIWLDNVQVRAFAPIRNDASVTKWQAPTATVFCNGNFAPVVTVTNKGTDTLRSVRLIWLLNGIRKDSAVFNNLAVASNKDTALVASPIAINEGLHRLAIFTSRPNGQPDEVPANDTLFRDFSVTGTAIDPVAQGWEKDNLPWQGWAPAPVFGSWQISNAAANTGSRSLLLNRFTDTASANSLELYSPVISARQDADSLFLRFAWAAAGRNQGGLSRTDTLEWWITADCGKTKQLLERRLGKELAATSSELAFIPAATEWRTTTIDLTSRLNVVSGGFQVLAKVLRGGGNNLWLDDLQLFSKTIPPALKQEGFGVYPNPFSNAFTIWHLLPQPTWKSAILTDAAGRVLRRWQWNGNAPQTLRIETANMPKGLYFLELEYEGLKRTRKLVKL